MREKTVFFALIIMFCIPCGRSYAATIGNPLDLDIPAKSALLREQAIDETLGEYEQAVKVKVSGDAEFLLNKDLNATSEVSGPEMEGNGQMAKIGVVLFNKIEPYIKVGTSTLTVKWKQGNDNIEVETDNGFAWGAGLKGVLWESYYSGIRLTGDIQYRISDQDIDSIYRSATGSNVANNGGDFEVKEWQAALLVSKKYELPLRWGNVYIVPYSGVMFSDSIVDVSFRDSNAPGSDFSLFDANNDKLFGPVFGCDIMPSLQSSYVLNFEAKFLTETSVSLGGTLKF